MLSEGIVDEAGNVMENGKIFILMEKYRQKEHILTTGEQEYGNFIMLSEKVEQTGYYNNGQT